MSPLKRFDWMELATVPEKPGIYAWYCRPHFARQDLEDALATIQSLSVNGKSNEAESYIGDFLQRCLFSLFQEDPFTADISGPLKPSYRGELKHEVRLSAGLVQRLRENPDRLREIQNVLEIATPEFASPIYIGMSSNLRARLNQHRAWIQKFRDEAVNNASQEDYAAGFARQVVNRGMRPERLFVVVCAIEAGDKIATDAENILNRISFPVLGRN